MKKLCILILVLLLCACSSSNKNTVTRPNDVRNAYPEYTGKIVIEYIEDESSDSLEEYTKYLYIGKDYGELHKQIYHFQYDSNIANVNELFTESIAFYLESDLDEVANSIDESGFTNTVCSYNNNDVKIYCTDDNSDIYTIDWNEETYEFTIDITMDIRELNYDMDDLISDYQQIDNVTIYR